MASFPLKSADSKPIERISANSGTTAPAGFAAQDGKLQAWAEKGTDEGVGVGSSSVALDMEFVDVRGERERVAGLTSLEQQCIVIQDLCKVYPAQVPLLRPPSSSSINLPVLQNIPGY